MMLVCVTEQVRNQQRHSHHQAAHDVLLSFGGVFES
jgi:hypothetical protein